MHVVNIILNGQHILQSPQHPSIEAAAAWRHELGNRLIAEGWIYNINTRVAFLPNSRMTATERLDNGKRIIILEISEQEEVVCTPSEVVVRIAMRLASVA